MLFLNVLKMIYKCSNVYIYKWSLFETFVYDLRTITIKNNNKLRKLQSLLLVFPLFVLHHYFFYLCSHIFKTQKMSCSGNGDKISVLSSLDLKAFFFDMDGVLFDSMPNHAKAWVYAFEQQGVKFDQYGAYMREGMTSVGTINDVFQLQLGRNATEEECEKIYKAKSDCFDSLGAPKIIPHVKDVLQVVKDAGLGIFIVTGSGQLSLLDTLDHSFPGFFQREKMVTAYDVKKGKPDPEPYLMALQKANLKPGQAVVVENAPLGVRSAVAAGIFTIAVNTGILKDKELTDNGADLVYKNMKSLYKDLLTVINNKKISDKK